MQQELMSMVLEKDEVSWQTVLYDLVKTEQMNPWDLDLSALTQRYILTVKQLQETNFRLSGKVLLAAAIMLKMKCDYFQDHDLRELDALFARMDENEGSEFFSEFSYDLFRTNEKIEKEDFRLIPRHPQPRKRKVSLQDLMNALKQAMEANRRKVVYSRPVAMVIPTNKFDVVAVIAHLYNKIKLHYKTNKDLKFTSLLPPGSKKEDKVYTFIPLLHLENERKVNMLQTEHFGEISIQLAKPQAN